jgi:UDP-glucose 4-epimerase
MPSHNATPAPARTNPVILIGGSGFLGRAYADHLGRRGRDVHLVGRADWGSGRADALAEAMARRDPEIVDFAYATVPSSSFADPVGDFTANLGAMIRHLEYSRRIGAARHLFVSSGGTVYGDQGNRPLAEDSPTRPISPYGITKLASEHYAEMYRRLGVPTLVVRPSNIFGPGQAPFRGQGLVATAFGAALAGRPLTLFGDGSQRRDYLFVDDCCTGLDAVLARGEVGQAYNLGCGDATSTADLLAAIGAITAADDCPLTIAAEPARPFDVGSNLLDIGRLRDGLGWHPTTSLDDGLQRTWRWIRES